MNNVAGHKLIWANNLMVIATIAVILQHVSANPIPLHHTIAPSYWWIGNIYWLKNLVLTVCIFILL